MARPLAQCCVGVLFSVLCCVVCVCICAKNKIKNIQMIKINNILGQKLTMPDNVVVFSGLKLG